MESLVSTIVNMMEIREKAKKAKRENQHVYPDPDLVIVNVDYYIKANLLLLQQKEKMRLGESIIYSVN